MRRKAPEDSLTAIGGGSHLPPADAVDRCIFEKSATLVRVKAARQQLLRVAAHRIAAPSSCGAGVVGGWGSWVAGGRGWLLPAQTGYR
jgi:hypothetical protein